MAAKDAPFATDLQPKRDVKLVGGNVISFQVHSKKQSSDQSTLSDDNAELGKGIHKLNIAMQNGEKKSHSRSSTYPLPAMCSSSAPPTRDLDRPWPALRLQGRHTSRVVPPPGGSQSHAGTPADVLRRVSGQVRQVRYWRNNLEDLARSCARLDQQCQGSIPLADVHKAVESYGFHINREDLVAIADACDACIDQRTDEHFDDHQHPSVLVLYRPLCAFLSQVVAESVVDESSLKSSNKAPYACHDSNLHKLTENTGRKSNCGMEHFSQPFPSTLRPYGRSLQHREHLHTSPSRLLLTKAKRNPLRNSLKPLLEVKAHNLSEAEKGIFSRDTARLLVKTEHMLQEHNWGSNTHMRHLEEALAARDKQRTGYLEVNEVRDACSEIGLPLPDHVLLPLLGRCIASKATNLVRWIAFADLLYKACPLHMRQQPLHSTWKTSPVLGGGTYSTQPSSASDRLTNYNPVDRHSPEYAGGRDGIHLGLSRLPRTVTFASADVIQENAEEDAGHVLVLIHRTLSSFADEEGLIELDEVYRTVKNYTAVYPASLRVDMLQLRAFCEECSTPHRGLPLAHTDDVMDYLRECV